MRSHIDMSVTVLKCRFKRNLRRESLLEVVLLLCIGIVEASAQGENWQTIDSHRNVMDPKHSAKDEDPQQDSFAVAGTLGKMREYIRDSSKLSRTSGKEHTVKNMDVASERFSAQEVAYTVARIEQANVTRTPYPHFHLTDVFHPQVYTCIQAMMPTSDKIYSKLEGRSNRFSVQLREEGEDGSLLRGPHNGEFKNFVPIPSSSKHINVTFWTRFSDAFSSPEVTRAYLNKMRATLQLRLQANPKIFTLPKKKSHEQMPAWDKSLDMLMGSVHWNMALNRDKSGYEIAPHTDADRKYVTVLYYLPPIDTNIPLSSGTCVMRSKMGKTQKRGSTRMNRNEFDLVEQAPFLPNSVFVFAACDASWHAVAELRGSYTRDSIQAFIRDNDKGAKKGTCPTLDESFL